MNNDNEPKNSALSKGDVNSNFTDKVEKWWNSLTYNQKRDYEKKTFSQEWFEDNTLVYEDIEKMYRKHILNCC